MYVRTRPKDNVRAVVTKEEADRIEEDWAIVSGTHEAFVAAKETRAREKERLRKRFGGREPSEDDINWSLANEALLTHAGEGDWGLYRNAKFQTGEILRRRMKLDAALRTYLEVCYLDLNGPSNVGGMSDPDLMSRFPAFDPEHSAFLAPGIVDRIQKISKKQGLGKSDVETIFLEHCSRIAEAMKLPRSVEDCWLALEKELA